MDTNEWNEFNRLLRQYIEEEVDQHDILYVRSDTHDRVMQVIITSRDQVTVLYEGRNEDAVHPTGNPKSSSRWYQRRLRVHPGRSSQRSLQNP